MTTLKTPSEAEAAAAWGRVGEPEPEVGIWPPLRLRLPTSWKLDEEQLLELCRLNEVWGFETDREGRLLIMAPSGPISSNQHGRIYLQIQLWSDSHGNGEAFESSAMFYLPSGENRNPDACWVSAERLAAIAADPHVIWHTCPDFVVEVRSASDRLRLQQEKMELWIEQGARLAWLVDPREQTVWVYTPNAETRRLERPLSLAAAEIADDLVIDFSRVWPPAPEEPAATSS